MATARAGVPCLSGDWHDDGHGRGRMQIDVEMSGVGTSTSGLFTRQ